MITAVFILAVLGAGVAISLILLVVWVLVEGALRIGIRLASSGLSRALLVAGVLVFLVARVLAIVGGG